MFMRLIFTAALGAILFGSAMPVFAQTGGNDSGQERTAPPSDNALPDETDRRLVPDNTPEPPSIDMQPAPEPDKKPGVTDGMEDTRDDIIITSDAERAQKLDELFAKLKTVEDADEANLVAEEIWAIWLRSGSASIDYVLGRGNVAQKAGNTELAVRMYDHVIRLEPEYAEGWIRSGRLALEEKNLSRAAAEITQGLIYEPRHFYGLWTLGNIFEQLGQTDEAFEAYSEALKVYPALKPVKERVEYLSGDVKGEAL